MSKSLTTEIRALGALGVLLLVGTWGLTMAVATSGPEKAELRSTQSFHPSGVSGWFEAMKRLGARVEKLDRDWKEVRLGDYDALFLLGPAVSLDELEQKRLDTWLQGGGTLVVAAGPNMMLGTIVQYVMPWKVNESGEKVGDRTEAYGNYSLARDVAVVSFETGVRFEEKAIGKQTLVPLFKDSEGVRIGKVTVGSGQLVLLADDSFLTNERIGKEDNAVLASRLLEFLKKGEGSGRIAYDETHYGLGQRQSRGTFRILGSALLSTAPGWAVQVLTFSGLLFLIANGWQFGRRRQDNRKARRSKLEFAHAVGTTWRQVGARHLTFRILWDELRPNLAAYCSLASDCSSGELADILALQTSKNREHLRKGIARLDEMRQSRVSERDLAAQVIEMKNLENLIRQKSK